MRGVVHAFCTRMLAVPRHSDALLWRCAATARARLVVGGAPRALLRASRVQAGAGAACALLCSLGSSLLQRWRLLTACAAPLTRT
jgi:hypothetical protein